MSDPTSSDPPGGGPPPDSPPNPPARYQVSYSRRVLAELKALISRAKLHGREQDVKDAAKEIEYRLSVYPQFGDPLRNLQRESSQIWVGVVPPVVVQYSIHEDIRQVWVVVPLVPLPGFLPETE